MENALDALKMAFAVLVFVIALTASMVAFGQAKEASEHVFYMTDKTNFYEYILDDAKSAEGRIVSGETIVPTLYRYYKENFNVIIIPKDQTLLQGNVSNKLLVERHNNFEKDSMEGKTDVNSYTYAVVFNLEEEIKFYNKDYKNAPWLGNANVDTKKRVDIELSGESQKINQVTYNPQMPGGLLEYFKGKQFREKFIEQRYSGKEVKASDNESLEIVKGNTKIWIVYEEVEQE